MQSSIDKHRLGQFRHDARAAVAGILNSLRNDNASLPCDVSRGILSNANYLLALLDELSSETGGSLPGAVPLGTHLEHLCHGFFASAELASIALSFQCDATEEKLVSNGFATAVSRIIGNLVSNAIEHSHANQVKIVAAINSDASGPDRLVLSVQDDGIGFCARTLGSHPGTGERGNGLGIVSTQLNRLSGSMRVESAPARGSQFEIQIPLPQVDEKTGVHRDMSFPGDSRNAPRTVLVIDDDPAVAAWVASALSGSEVSCLGAASIDEALENDLGTIGLVLLDLHLGESSGAEAARRLRKEGYLRGLVALTALPEAAQRSETLLDGCIDKLSGPSAVRSAVLHWLGSPRATQDAPAAEALTASMPT